MHNRKLLILVSAFIYVQVCFSQENYSKYYEIRSKSALSNDYNQAIYYTIEAFKYNRPLPLDLLSVSSIYAYTKNTKHSNFYLLKAALSGVSRAEVKLYSYSDTNLVIDKKLSLKFDRKYNKFLRKKCDLLNSFKIIKLAERDQNIRSFYSSYSIVDTSFKQFRAMEMIKQDSINYFTLLEIMNKPDFNSSRLTLDARHAIGLILAHSVPANYACPDSVFSILKREMLKGTIAPEFYAFSYDRYYMYQFGMNYYCVFYNSFMPIYDIQNVDKRRNELWIYPLYVKFEKNGELDKLPKDYHYDSNSIIK